MLKPCCLTPTAAVSVLMPAFDPFEVSPNHRNVVLHVHEPHRMLGKPDSTSQADTTIVSIFALLGRSLTAKRRLHQLIVKRLGALGITADSILIRLHESEPENYGVRGGQALCDVELGYPMTV